MEEKECAILLDIENLLRSACDDLAAQAASNNKLVGRIIGYVNELALGYAPAVRPYAALGFTRKQKTVPWISFELVKAGFRVMIVPAGPNAADHALRDLGFLLAVDDKVGTVILATGDGREPFPELLETLLSCGKRVHMVSYDGAPLSMWAEGALHSSLAPHLRLLLEEGKIEPPIAVGCFTSAAYQPTDEESNPPAVAIPVLLRNEVAPETDIVEAVKRSYRKAARAILTGASIEGLERAVTNLTDAYEAMMKELGWAHGGKRFSFGHLLGVLERARASGRLQAESDEEVGWIAKALANFTDAFDRTEVYVPNPNGRFADLIRMRG